MTRESFPGYVAPKGPLVHWIREYAPYMPCGARCTWDIERSEHIRRVTCEACRRAWREAQEG